MLSYFRPKRHSQLEILTLVSNQQRMYLENSAAIFQPALRTFWPQNYVVVVCSAAVSEKVDRRWKREVDLRSLEEELGLVDCKAISTLFRLSRGSAAVYLSFKSWRACVLESVEAENLLDTGQLRAARQLDLMIFRYCSR
jgi:hypothetical protein